MFWLSLTVEDTRTHVQLNSRYYIPILQGAGKPTIILYSVTEKSDMIRNRDYVNSPLGFDTSQQTWNETINFNYPPCLQKECREANCIWLTGDPALSPFEHCAAELSQLIQAAYWINRFNEG